MKDCCCQRLAEIREIGIELAEARGEIAGLKMRLALAEVVSKQTTLRDASRDELLSALARHYREDDWDDEL